MRYVLPFALLLTACAATSSGVIADGPDTYRIMESGKTGFVSSGDLKIHVMKRAAAHCTSQGKTLQTIAVNEQRGGVLGKFPSAEVHFRCI